MTQFTQAYITPKYAPIVIVGGGAVGATTAMLLAQSMPDVQITLVDGASNTQTVLVDKHESRVFALSMASIMLLNHTGTWDYIQRRADYNGMELWHSDAVGMTNLTQTRGTEEPEMLGSMIETGVLHAAIQQSLQQYSNIQVVSNTRLVHAENISNAHIDEHIYKQHNKPVWKLVLEHNNSVEHVYTPLVIGADGRNSKLRALSNIGFDTLAYDKTAVSCAVKVQKPHNNIARQVFLPTGPLALLPLANLANTSTEDTDTFVSVVWTLPTEQANEYAQLPKEVLAQKLTEASTHELGQVKEVYDCATFPLSAMQAHNYVAQGLALVGDSAHGVHPLAGQGLNLGLLDSAVLTEQIIGTYERSRGNVLATQTCLNKYQQLRKPHNGKMMHSFSMIGFAFGEQNFTCSHVTNWLRNEILQAGNALNEKTPKLREFFNVQASGLNELAQTRWYIADTE